MMDLVRRAVRICTHPASEWDAIEAEPTPPLRLAVGYVLPLAILGAAATAAGELLVGPALAPENRVEAWSSIRSASSGILIAIAICYLQAAIIDRLSPHFGGRRDYQQAFKLAAYSSTPAFLAELLRIVPPLGILGWLALIYAVYLLYVGLPKLMKTPAAFTLRYTRAVVALTILVLMLLILPVLVFG